MNHTLSRREFLLALTTDGAAALMPKSAVRHVLVCPNAPPAGDWEILNW